MNTLLSFIRSILINVIPESVYERLQPVYHGALSRFARLYYRNPSKDIVVVGVTGTKGKSSVVEILNALFEESGYPTALASTIRFKVGEESRRNLFKMTMPGRFFLQKFLREAVDTGCEYAFIEMTSEGAKLNRHVGIELDALIFTNLQKEHIESHGSFENYRDCKLRLRDLLEASPKRPKYMIVHRDDTNAEYFLEIETAEKITFGIKDVEPYVLKDRGSLMTIDGMSVHSPLVGKFNVLNILPAVRFAQTQGLHLEKLKPILERFDTIKGRVERIEHGQPFTVLVDYAHTPDSLEALYQAFAETTGRKICVLGNTGGGRDTWKRPEMGRIADAYCDRIILTNEDPYDEDPFAILDDMKKGISEHRPKTILDRRHAIRQAITMAKKGDTVFVTGKGTDPYIMGARGSKIEWSDAEVVGDELERLQSKR